MTVVLDASALVTLLRLEPGAGRVNAALAGAAMSTVNLGEVVSHFARNGLADDDIRQLLDPVPIVRMPFDEEAAYAVGLMLPATKRFGLSFGDRACLVLAHRLGAVALTADRSWSAIGDTVGVSVELIR